MSVEQTTMPMASKSLPSVGWFIELPLWKVVFELAVAFRELAKGDRPAWNLEKKPGNHDDLGSPGLLVCRIGG